MKVPQLNKSEFVRGLDCERRLWLDRFRPELRPAPSIAALDRMEMGKTLGRLGRSRYPDGVFVPTRFDDLEGSAAATAELIGAGAPCIFEATFIADGRYARVDILSKGKAGGWILDEVKSSSVKEPDKIDDDKVFDLAFQTRTAERAGLTIEASQLVLVNTGYVWPGGNFDASTLMGVVDLTGRCAELRDKIDERCDTLSETLTSSNEPVVETNTHCKKCDYFDHCHKGGPKHDVIHLPRMSPKAVRELREKGFHSIEQIPADYKLTDARRRMRDVIVSGVPHISVGLREAIAAVTFPAAFVDFESVNPALPMYVGTRPYQQVCFQWSAHVLESPTSEPAHSEYLAASREDPREEFCSTLWEVVRSCHSIVHYTGYEMTQLRAMASDGVPKASDLLEAIESRTVDLEKIVSDHLYFAEFVGRTSIKVVLPALVPSLGYQELMISDGTAAAAGFRQMIAPETPPDEAESLRRALLDYCRQDTRAMVEIFRALQGLAS